LYTTFEPSCPVLGSTLPFYTGDLFSFTLSDSREALRDRIFAAAEHIRNHPNNAGSATQSLLMRAENCIAAGGGHFEQLL